MRWLAIILTAIFTAAKLAGVIAWSWWLVMLPAIFVFGIPVLIAVLLMVIGIVIKIAMLVQAFNRSVWDGFKQGWHDGLEEHKHASSKHEN